MMVGYADRRDAYSRALWAHAISLRSVGHEHAARQGAITALVRIALHREPLRNAAQARSVPQVGGSLR